MTLMLQNAGCTPPIRRFGFFAALLVAASAEAGPGCKREPGRASVEARVVEAAISGSDMVFVIDKGSDQGVTKEWQGILLSPEGKPDPVSCISLTEVGKTELKGKLRGAGGQEVCSYPGSCRRILLTAR